MVTRRAVGIAVVLLAVLAVVVAARLDGSRVAGRAIAPPGLSAPDVGDCVASFADPAQAAVGPDIAGGTGVAEGTAAPRRLPDVGVIEESGVTFTGCAGDHLGEVVAYRRMALQQQGDADRTADIDWCRSVAADYRAHLQWRVNDASGGLWLPSTGQRFTAVLSAPFVDPQEPRWSACLVLPPDGERYRGSYLRSLAVGPAPAPFGRCLTGTPTERPVSCTALHTGQEFGVTSGPVPAGRSGIASCRALIAAMSGLRDITAGGRLRTELVSGATSPVAPTTGTSTTGTSPPATSGLETSPPATAPPATAPPATAPPATAPPGTAPASTSSCRLSVVGEHRLTGTLIGVGDDSVPFA